MSQTNEAGLSLRELTCDEQERQNIIVAEKNAVGAVKFLTSSPNDEHRAIQAGQRSSPETAIDLSWFALEIPGVDVKLIALTIIGMTGFNDNSNSDLGQLFEKFPEVFTTELLDEWRTGVTL